MKNREIQLSKSEKGELRWLRIAVKAVLIIHTMKIMKSYMCDINMDEDEYMRLISDQHYQCPYYRNGDEYMVVRKQM